jgi:hypothetical protein
MNLPANGAIQACKSAANFDLSTGRFAPSTVQSNTLNLLIEIGIGGRDFCSRPCHTTWHAGPRRAVRASWPTFSRFVA